MINASKKLILTIFTLALLAFLISSYFWLANKQANLEVIFFDIGQGDSILIKTPGKQNILIDGGPDAKVVYKLGKYLPFYDKTIDLMILSHPHSDHVAGLVDVLKRYNVKQVLGAGVIHTSSDYLKWLELIKEKNIKFIKVAGSRKIVFAGKQGKDAILDVLYPFNDVSRDDFEDLNNSSIVVKLTYGKQSFLFTGDLPVEGEEMLLLNKADLKSDVLKVGHHGSKYSSSVEFLEQVKPKYAVIQSGQDNSFGHPHLRTLRNLEKLGIAILRTDEVGDVVFSVDKGLTLK